MMGKAEKVEIQGTNFGNGGTVSQDDTDKAKQVDGETKVPKDLKSIALLFLLYCLQGIPFGLAASVPLILASKSGNYKQQATFTLAMYPFSVKLLWAPIVDSLFIPAFGRRKSWLIPAQYCIGLSMLYLSYRIDEWLDFDNGRFNLTMITLFFFLINFLAATQDIAVDGWALTMLDRRHVGWASTCNSTGQATGFFLGFAFFMALESADFCNKYLRTIPQDTGMVTLAEFLFFWSMVFFATTTMVALFKTEVHDDIDEANLSIKESYLMLLKIVKLPAVQLLIIILITIKFPYAPWDSVFDLKLIELGLSRDFIALVRVPLIPLNIFTIFMISRWTAGPTPLSFMIWTIPIRLAFNFIAAAFIWATPFMIQNGTPWYYYVLFVLLHAVQNAFFSGANVALMAFFARVSDPNVGGTYMTILNTVTNLGAMWPSSVILWLMDVLSWRNCEQSSAASAFNETSSFNTSSHLQVWNVAINKCANTLEKEMCKKNGGICDTKVDAYYVETVFCTLVGIIWILLLRNKILRLQSLDEICWQVTENQSNNANNQKVRLPDNATSVL